LFERPETGTRAILVQLDLRSDPRQDGREEFHQLAVSAGVEPVASIGGSRDRPDPRLFIGSGKADEILKRVNDTRAQLVLFNHPLTPVQERNLERVLNCRVLDRTGLILDIFAQRARTFEGKLQVELAQLKHLATRLVRGWSHLERQKGGIGLRGPGETQLETDRRLIGRRIKQLNKRLERVRRHRELSRRSRRRATVTAISLVGYTNAGKSTLFNRLTGSRVYEADQLFATLDPTLRRCEVPGLGHLVLADTVGFISDLPPDLVAAFHATLEETVEADLLLHVIDAHDEAHQEQAREVNAILAGIGAAQIPQIEVYNKIDLRADGEPRIDFDSDGLPKRVWLSARDGAGVDLLLRAMAQRLLEFRQGHGAGNGMPVDERPTGNGSPFVRLRLQPNQGRLRAQLFEWNVVCGESSGDSGEWFVDVLLRPGLLSYLQRHEACVVNGGGEYAEAHETCDEPDRTIKSATVNA
jgi:GTP-binding protein HflX